MSIHTYVFCFFLSLWIPNEYKISRKNWKITDCTLLKWLASFTKLVIIVIIWMKSIILNYVVNLMMLSEKLLLLLYSLLYLNYVYGIRIGVYVYSSRNHIPTRQFPHHYLSKVINGIKSIHLNKTAFSCEASPLSPPCQHIRSCMHSRIALE